MEHVENLLKTTLSEIEKLLSTRTVVGEPIVLEGNTVIPLISIGFVVKITTFLSSHFNFLLMIYNSILGSRMSDNII